MTNRIIQKSFAAPAFPRRIEDDPMFNGWNRNLPRLWYLDQRQATRLDAESLYGASQYAVFYNRTQFTNLAAIIETATIGDRGYARTAITDIGIPLETSGRLNSYTRVQNTILAVPTQEPHTLRPSGGPVNPIVHPITAASIGEGAPPIGGTPNFKFLAQVVGLQEGTLAFLTMQQPGKIVAIRSKRVGGGDISFNLSFGANPIMAYDMSLPTADGWYSYETSDIVYTNTLHVGDQINLTINDVVGATWPDELLIEITFVIDRVFSTINTTWSAWNASAAAIPFVTGFANVTKWSNWTSAANGVQSTPPTMLTYTGAFQTYVVPAGRTSLAIDMAGAQGGDSNMKPGGKGGRLQCTIAVTPGETLRVYIGGQGVTSGFGGPSQYPGGFNGGGDAWGYGGSGRAGTGGGATDIRRGAFTLADRIVTAGAGGGASAWDGAVNDGPGGAGGGPVGQVGQEVGNGAGSGIGNDRNGGGGTQTAGGVAGNCQGGITATATAGALGVGGMGAAGSTIMGGGGGAGKYGGGGGGLQTNPPSGVGGGGGGSSDAGTATSVTHTQGYQTGNGYCQITPL